MFGVAFVLSLRRFICLFTASNEYTQFFSLPTDATIEFVFFTYFLCAGDSSTLFRFVRFSLDSLFLLSMILWIHRFPIDWHTIFRARHSLGSHFYSLNISKRKKSALSTHSRAAFSQQKQKNIFLFSTFRNKKRKYWKPNKTIKSKSIQNEQQTTRKERDKIVCVRLCVRTAATGRRSVSCTVFYCCCNGSWLSFMLWAGMRMQRAFSSLQSMKWYFNFSYARWPKAQHHRYTGTHSQRVGCAICAAILLESCKVLSFPPFGFVVPRASLNLYCCFFCCCSFLLFVVRRVWWRI